MLKIPAASVLPYNPRYNPTLPPLQRLRVTNLSAVRNATVNRLAPSDVAQNFTPSRQYFQDSVNALSAPLCPETIALISSRAAEASSSSTSSSHIDFPIDIAALQFSIDSADLFVGGCSEYFSGDNPAELPCETSIAAAQVAALDFSPESAEVVVGYVFSYFPESLIQSFLCSLPSIACDSETQKRVAQFIRNGAGFTLPEVLNRVGITKTEPLFTQASLETIANLVRATIDVPGFLKNFRVLCSATPALDQDKDEQKKLTIVIFALVHFAFKGRAEPFFLAMGPLAIRCGAGSGRPTHRQLYFNYLDTKPVLEKIFEENRHELDLAALRTWGNFIVAHNSQQKESIRLLQKLDKQFAIVQLRIQTELAWMHVAQASQMPIVTGARSCGINNSGVNRVVSGDSTNNGKLGS